MFNPMAFGNPHQLHQLEKMQVLTRKIRCTVHTEDDRVEFALKTEDDEAKQVIPQLQEALNPPVL